MAGNRVVARADVLIGARADRAQVKRALRTVESDVDRAGSRRITVGIDVDSRKALAAFSGVLGQAASLTLGIAAIGPAATAAFAAAAFGAGSLASALAAATAGAVVFGAAVIPAVTNVAAAVKALDADQKAAMGTFSTAMKQRTQSSYAAAQAAQRVADAQQQAARSEVSALREVQKAQEALTEARRAARRELEDLRERSGDLARDEERARLDLARAEADAAAAAEDQFLTDEERREIALALADAQDALSDVQRDRQHNTEDLTEAERNGVDGSDQVVDALERQRDAQEALNDAQTEGARAVADALAAQAHQAEMANLQMSAGSASSRNLATALGELTPMQRLVYERFIQMREGFTLWAQSLERATLPVFLAAMGLVEQLLPRLTPLVEATAGAFSNLLERAQRSLESPFWQEFFDFLARTAGPAIESFGTILGNLAVGFAGILMAFEPFTARVTGGLVEISEAFAEWGQGLGESEGFKRFIDFVDRTWPPLKDTLFAVGDAFVHIVESLLPLAGGGVLDAIKGVADFIAGMDPQTIRDIAESMVLFAGAIKIIGIGTAIAGLGPWGALILAIGAAFVIAYTEIEPFREGVQKLIEWFQEKAVPAIQDFADEVVKFFEEKVQPVLEDFGRWFEREVVPVLEWLGETFVRKIGELVDFVVRNWPRIQDAIGRVIGILKALWDNVLFPILDHLFIFLRDVLGPIWLWLWHEVVYPAITGIADIVAWAWHNVIKPTFDKVKSGVEFVVDKFIFMKDAIGLVFTAIKNTAKTIWDRIIGVIRGAVNAAIKIINLIGDGIETVAGAIGLDITIRDIPLLGQSGNNFVQSPGEGGALAHAMGTYDLAKRGPFMTNGPRAIVGEGDPRYPEYVIPTDPRFRGRGLDLFAKLGAALGMARGGTVPMMQGGGVLGIGGAIDKISDAARGIRELGEKLFGLPRKALTWLKDKALDWAKSHLTGGSAGASVRGLMASNRELGEKLNAARGWAQFWPALDALVMSESGWNNFAQNPTSTAFGIGQFLNSTWATVGYRKTSDPRIQILAMLDYIAQRYGNPSRAWSFKQAHNYYAAGGLPPSFARGLYKVPFDNFPAMLHRKEMVLPADAAEAARAELEGRGSGGNIIFNIERGAFVFNGVSAAEAERATRTATKAFLKTIQERKILTDSRLS